VKAQSFRVDNEGASSSELDANYLDRLFSLKEGVKSGIESTVADISSTSAGQQIQNGFKKSMLAFMVASTLFAGMAVNVEPAWGAKSGGRVGGSTFRARSS